MNVMRKWDKWMELNEWRMYSSGINRGFLQFGALPGYTEAWEFWVACLIPQGTTQRSSWFMCSCKERILQRSRRDWERLGHISKVSDLFITDSLMQYLQLERFVESGRPVVRLWFGRMPASFVRNMGPNEVGLHVRAENTRWRPLEVVTGHN